MQVDGRVDSDFSVLNGLSIFSFLEDVTVINPQGHFYRLLIAESGL